MSDVQQIWVKGTKVGMVGLKQVFEQVSAEADAGEPRPEDPELGERLVELAGRNNYIAEAARDDYRAALLREYKRFLGMEVPEENPVMEIKVFGRSGCTRCSSLSEEIMSVLADLEIAADFEHVTDLDRFAELGPVAPPVVTRNGRIVSTGRTLNRDQIIKLVTEA